MKLRYLSLLILTSFALSTLCYGGRIKDLASLEGSRDNQLVGYGIVVGLAGDGDSTSDVTINSLANSLKNFGLTVDTESMKADNVAAVMITADIPPFAREGTRIDITVSSIGDAESLQGGVLLQTPLYGADQVVYAVAQGQIAVGGFIGGAAGPGGATV
ncbi:MAG: flagellar basal body P-ring protein FlgI, partial [Verrucomicrobiota bacterium]|nr:flagellar basal body P-ring protein FlgI [Verrucomicrobiota bacterium]